MLKLQRYMEKIGDEKLSVEHTPQESSAPTNVIYAQTCHVYRNMKKAIKMPMEKLKQKDQNYYYPNFFSKSLPGNTDCEILLIKTELTDQFIAFRFALNKDAKVKIHT